MTAHDAWSSERLRHAALARLGEHADPRAVDTLAHATLALTTAVAQWSTSGGRIAGHRVTMAIDARQLGQLRASPGVLDALCAAIAATIAERPGESLVNLAVRWAPGARPASAGYRDAPAPPVDLKDALVEYLEGAGSQGLAATASRTVVHASAGGVLSVRALDEDATRLDDASALAELTRALRDLLGEKSVRVRISR